MKLATYPNDDGASKVGHVEGGEIRALGGLSTLECNEHERNTDRRRRCEVMTKELGRLVNPVRADGACGS